MNALDSNELCVNVRCLTCFIPWYDNHFDNITQYTKVQFLYIVGPYQALQKFLADVTSFVNESFHKHLSSTFIVAHGTFDYGF